MPLKFKAPARALSLLTYLFVHGSAPLSRDAVAFALWPDDMESDARANLRRHLFYLTNDVLPPPAPHTPWIVADKRTIGWNAQAPACCDLRAFVIRKPERTSSTPSAPRCSRPRRFRSGAAPWRGWTASHPGNSSATCRNRSPPDP